VEWRRNIQVCLSCRHTRDSAVILEYLLCLILQYFFSFRENYILNISSLWEGYPHNEMVFMFKFFFIVQLSYWLHCYPELYFQKAKREEMPARITYATLGLVYVLGAYLLK
jgi:translocating chain-associated membrane protein 1